MKAYILFKKDGTPHLVNGGTYEIYRSRSTAEKALYSQRKKDGDYIKEIKLPI